MKTEKLIFFILCSVLPFVETNRAYKLSKYFSPIHIINVFKNGLYYNEIENVPMFLNSSNSAYCNAFIPKCNYTYRYTIPPEEYINISYYNKDDTKKIFSEEKNGTRPHSIPTVHYDLMLKYFDEYEENMDKTITLRFNHKKIRFEFVIKMIDRNLNATWESRALKITYRINKRLINKQNDTSMKDLRINFNKIFYGCFDFFLTDQNFLTRVQEAILKFFKNSILEVECVPKNCHREIVMTHFYGPDKTKWPLLFY